MLNKEQLMEIVYASIDIGVAYQRRRHNVTEFNSLPRENCTYGSREVQYPLHKTTWDETVYQRAPGKESKPTSRKVNPWDTRPIVHNKEGKSPEDATLTQINDIWLYLSKTYPEDIDFFALLMLCSSYLLHPLVNITTRGEYINLHNNWKSKYAIKPKISIVRNSCYEIESTTQDINLRVHLPIFTEEFWETVNARYHIPDKLWNSKEKKMDDCPFKGYSMEAFFFVYDLINQNEDIKYDYYGKSGLTFPTTEKKYDIDSGRIKSGMTFATTLGIALGWYDGWENVDLIHHVLTKSGDEGGCRPMPLKLMANSELLQKHMEILDTILIYPVMKTPQPRGRKKRLHSSSKKQSKVHSKGDCKKDDCLFGGE